MTLTKLLSCAAAAILASCTQEPTGRPETVRLDLAGLIGTWEVRSDRATHCSTLLRGISYDNCFPDTVGVQQYRGTITLSAPIDSAASSDGVIRLRAVIQLTGKEADCGGTSPLWTRCDQALERSFVPLRATHDSIGSVTWQVDNRHHAARATVRAPRYRILSNGDLLLDGGVSIFWDFPPGKVPSIVYDSTRRVVTEVIRRP